MYFCLCTYIYSYLFIYLDFGSLQLALLLHQELNSSPRVPRVPRVRNAGSFPQLSSPSTTSMLIKRTSSSGGKDHSLVRYVVYWDVMKNRQQNLLEDS